MKDLIKITVRAPNGREFPILVRESLVESIVYSEEDKVAVLFMSSGAKLDCVDPPYEAWENDTLA